MPRLLLVPSLVLVLAGACSSPSRYVRFGAVLPPKVRDCELRIYAEGERPRNAVVLGRVEAEGRRRASIDAELRSQACALGADALMAIEVAEFTGSRATMDDNRDVKVVDEGEVVVGQALAVLLRDASPVRKFAPARAPEPLDVFAAAPCTPAAPPIPEPAAPSAPPPAKLSPTRSSPEPELLDTLLPPPFEVDAR